MMQPLDELGEICEKYGALLIVDAVATLGGAEVKVDDWKLSACISEPRNVFLHRPDLH